DGSATGSHACAASSQYSSSQESGRTTPSPLPGFESRQNFSSAPVRRTGRDQSYRTHWVAGRLPDHVPQIWAWLGSAGSAPSLSAPRLFQPAVYDALAVAMGATLPVSGPEMSAGIVTDRGVSAFPATSTARNDTRCWFVSGAATGPSYACHAPVPIAYSARATPGAASVAVPVTVRAASSSVPLLPGATRSIRTSSADSAETLPARSVAVASTRCSPSPATATSVVRVGSVVTGAPSSTVVARTTRPPESSTASTRTRTSERNQPALPALPSGVSVRVGAV